MFVRYADDTKELEIKGTDAEFAELSRRLLEDGAIISCEASEGEVAPYSRFLDSIVIQFVADQFVELRVPPDGVLLISGDINKLEILSKNISNFGRDCGKAEHMHLEYYASDIPING